MIEIPEAFVRLESAENGAQRRAWIAALPDLVDRLLQRWSCTPVGPVAHGQVGIVVPVSHPDLPPAVVKVSFPHPGNVHDPDAYTTWNGNGAVRLFARDDDNVAMLLERASPRTLATVTDPEEALAIQGELSHRLAVPAPPGLPRLSDLTERWEHEIVTTAAAFGDPIPRGVLAEAVATLRELGPDQPDILIHGDLHDANVLASDREPWLAIDPRTLVGDPAHEALNVIRAPRFIALSRSPNLRSTARRFLDIYCEAAELDTERVRRWTQLGAVREAMWGRRHGGPEWEIRAIDHLAVALG